MLREAEEFTLNDLLQRGWQILALEYQGEVSKTGELTNRKASFVLGHADPWFRADVNRSLVFAASIPEISRGLKTHFEPPRHGHRK